MPLTFSSHSQPSARLVLPRGGRPTALPLRSLRDLTPLSCGHRQLPDVRVVVRDEQRLVGLLALPGVGARAGVGDDGRHRPGEVRLVVAHLLHVDERRAGLHQHVELGELPLDDLGGGGGHGRPRPAGRAGREDELRLLLRVARRGDERGEHGDQCQEGQRLRAVHARPPCSVEWSLARQRAPRVPVSARSRGRGSPRIARGEAAAPSRGHARSPPVAPRGARAAGGGSRASSARRTAR